MRRLKKWLAFPRDWQDNAGCTVKGKMKGDETESRKGLRFCAKDFIQENEVKL